MNTITLYINTKILEEKNFIVEDIETYLSSVSALKLEREIQYIKNGLDVDVKIDIGQSYLDKDNLFLVAYNYAKIQNDNGGNYYYFIRSIKWISKNAIKLNLRLDVLNSFMSGLSFTKKTQVLREHSSRWFNTGTLTSGNYLQAKVDDVNEEIGDLVKQVKSSKVIYENENEPSQRWFLLYRTPDLPTPEQPIQIELIPNFDYRIGTVGSNTITLNKEYFSSGYTYYITNKDNVGGVISIKAGSTTKYLDDSYLTQNRYVAFTIHRGTTGSQKLTVSGIRYGNNNTEPSVLSLDTTFIVSDLDSVQITNAFYMRRNQGETGNDVDVDLDKIQNEYSRIQIAGAIGEPVYSKKIDEVNKTDSRIIKIIECPYCPIDLDVDFDKYIVDTTTRAIKIKVGVELLNNPVDLDLSNVIEVNKQITWLNNIRSKQRYLMDSKLLHSNFTELKVVYDSYAKIYALENCSFFGSTQTPTTTQRAMQVVVYYKHSNTISSSLAFYFEPLFNEKGESDYFQYLVSTRNNDVQLYHNEYVNYMRTDYNYARKSQQLQTINNIFNTATAGIGGAIAGGVSGGVGGAIAGALTGSIKGLQSTITQAIQTANNIEQTQLNKKMAATGVQGSDDLNLFNYYGYNKLILKVYQPKEYIIKKLDDLFYYYGYKRDYKGIPNTSSRVWFNYLQCIPDFEKSNYYSKMGEECKVELRNKFAQGCTYLHKNNIPLSTQKYDFEQQMENWEVDLL